MAARPVRRRPAKTTSLRQNMWRSMRIMRRFTIPDIIRTVPGATLTNAYKYFYRLEKAGIIKKIGNYVSGRSGEFQQYALILGDEPVMPVLGYGKGSDVPQRTNDDPGGEA